MYRRIRHLATTRWRGGDLSPFQFHDNRRPSALKARGLRYEMLEPRIVLDSGPFITEFMAINNSTTRDQDGEYSDWLEIYNPSSSPIDLSGWYLTDDEDNLEKWMFPAVTIPAGDYLVVFTSDKDRTDPMRELHTNFKLSGSGEYLALVKPDGTTIAHEYDPNFPEQFQDISYGPLQGSIETTFVEDQVLVRALIPESAGEDVPTSTWTAAGYDDSSWQMLITGIGYDVGGELDPLIHEGGDTSSMQGNTASAYLRSTFNIIGAVPDYDQLLLDVHYDDGFVAYLNGVEVASSNAPEGPLSWESTATGNHGGTITSIDYNGFGDGESRDDFSLLGNAAWSSTRLRLTRSAADQAGAAWISNPFKFGEDYSFNTYMAIDVHSPAGQSDPDGPGGDGMTFVLQAAGNNRLGGSGGALGLDGTGMAFVAVEFDSWYVGSFDPNDSLPSHVGIDTSIAGNLQRVGVAPFNGGESGANIRYVWIDYNGVTDLMEVFFSSTTDKPAVPILSTEVDLAELYGGITELYAGWTAGTGTAFNCHDVLEWEMTTDAGDLGLTSETFDISEYIGLLQTGENVFAIHGLNETASDDDFLILPTLTATELSVVHLDELKYYSNPTPGEPNSMGTEAPAGLITYSVASKTFSAPFQLILSTSSANASIRYTTNGAIPDESSTLYTGPLTISASTRIRARAFETGLAPGPVESESYLLIGSSLTNFRGTGEAFDSNLPLMIFDSFGNYRVNSEATRLVPVSCVFINTGTDGKAVILGDAEFGGRAGMRIRGQSSEGWPKHQYALEFWSESVSDTGLIYASATEDLAVSIFGLPEESDWVLNGPYSDKTQLNNYLSFLWSNAMGLYAPRAMLVEVFVNSNGGAVEYPTDYVGTYVLLEKIKIDENRVDIAQLSPADTTEPAITGGYIWKKDKAGVGDVPFTTSRGQQFRHADPDDSEITAAQTAWLTNYINQFEAALYGPNFTDPELGYQKYIDVDSWIDTWILVEMTKNIDGFRLSTYYHKDRGGKIKQGPAWDYNLALSNANYLEGAYPNGWYHGLCNDYDYPYWRRLFQDPNFVQRLVDRWYELRQTIFSTENLLADIDAAVQLISDGNPNPQVGDHFNPVSRNFTKWTNITSYLWPNPFFGVGDYPTSPLGRSPSKYSDYIYIMKWFIQNRVDWMDQRYVEAPTISVVGNQVTITAPAGDIYYTANGTDPRAGFSSSPSQETLLPAGSEVAVLIPENGGLGTSWTALGFNDDSWIHGTSGVGYDDNPDYDPYIGLDVTTAMDGVNATAYIRSTFTVSGDPASYNYMALQIQCDDGFIAYLNGVRVASYNAPASPDWQSEAPTYNNETFAISFTEYDISDYLGSLQQGQNVLAIHGLNAGATSSDFLITPRIVAGSDYGLFTPDAVRYSGPFTVDENAIIAARVYDESHSIAETTDFSGLATAAVILETPVLAISEINYNPHNANLVPGLGELDVDNDEYEFIEVINPSLTETASLIGVQFTGSIEFNFTGSPVTQLGPGERVLVVGNQAAFESRYGTSRPIAGEFENGTRLSNAGEMIRLEDGVGNVIQEFTYSDGNAWPGRADGGGSSLVVVDANGDYDDPDNWRNSLAFGGTPGMAPLADTLDVVINEVLAHTDPPLIDSIELTNVSDVTIDIGGWWLSDNNNNYFKFQIPTGMNLASGQYVVFDESQFNSGGGSQSNDFALSADGEDVWLIQVDGNGCPIRFADHVSFDATLIGVSLGRLPDGSGELFPLAQRSLGQANGAHLAGDVIITELHYNPADTGSSVISRDQLEFVELYNRSGMLVDVSNWRLRGGIDFDLPQETILANGSVLVIVSFDPSNTVLDAEFRAIHGIDNSVTLLGPWDGVLDNGGETIKLLAHIDPPVGETDPTYYLVDRAIYDDDAPWPIEPDGNGPSLTRISAENYGDYPASWLAATPTPGTGPMSADFNLDGSVDGEDLQIWDSEFGNTSGAAQTTGDADGDGDVDGNDFLIWQTGFGSMTGNAVGSGSKADGKKTIHGPTALPVLDSTANPVVDEVQSDRGVNPSVNDPSSSTSLVSTIDSVFAAFYASSESPVRTHVPFQWSRATGPSAPGIEALEYPGRPSRTNRILLPEKTFPAFLGQPELISTAQTQSHPSVHQSKPIKLVGIGQLGNDFGKIAVDSALEEPIHWMEHEMHRQGRH
ncbi:MAG: lamin tail domain-containing protein [Pirellulales bacterium]|nr:lamin tail domain-containing protein [Pirellulales bacterium]